MGPQGIPKEFLWNAQGIPWESSGEVLGNS